MIRALGLWPAWISAQDTARAAELRRGDWRLVVVVLELLEELDEYGVTAQLSSVERTFARTREIYQQSGRTPPSSPGVHDVRPVRGADLVPVGGCSDELGQTIATTLCGRIVYPRGFRSVLWHDVGAGAHWHCQVPWDALELHAGP